MNSKRRENENLKGSNKLDHVLILETNGKSPISFVFCPSTLDKETSRTKVMEVLKKESLDHFGLDYLGVLNYKNMDDGIKKYFPYFKKYNDILIYNDK